MSIESLTNTGINISSLSGYKPNVDTTVQSPDVELQKMETPELQDVELMSAKASENFQENSEEQQKNLEEAVEKLNETANIFHHSLKFSIHEATHRTMISVVDTDTDKVIREIPGEEALDMVARMQEYLGLIFDKEA